MFGKSNLFVASANCRRIHPRHGLARLAKAIMGGLLCAWLVSSTWAETNDGVPVPPQPESGIPADVLSRTWGVGPWIWGPETHDKQTCRLWRSFEIPRGAVVAKAGLRISVDNGYRLMLDGREIGTGSDWRSITEYDLVQSLKPGHHVVAVEGFNDNREAGVQFGLKIELKDGKVIDVRSDTDWRYVPADERGWESVREAPAHWGRAVMVSALLPRQDEWLERVPTMLMKVSVPPPMKLQFLKSTWFQVMLWGVVTFALLLCLRLMARLAVQSKAQELLRRERARIARDIHDELGARLTELALEGEVIQTELPEGSSVVSKLEALCEKARAVSGAMDEVVWLVNSRRDTLRDFATYACKHARRFLGSSPIRCRLDVDPDLPEAVLEMPLRRSLLLGVKEALNNAAKYSDATELFLRIYRRGQTLFVVVEDNGSGFDLALVNSERNGLSNMTERMKEFGGKCRIRTSVGAGCLVEFQVPLPKQASLPDDSGATRELSLDGIHRLTAGLPPKDEEVTIR